jgi:carbonic anhydrase/acetyltransferase-like protein (isoleucine patch superfamily)
MRTRHRTPVIIVGMNLRFIRTPGNAFVAPTAIVVGDVEVQELASFWFGAVVRGDVAPIRIGRRVNVQDNCVIHCDSGVPNVIEDDVTIGHSAIVHGTQVGAGSLIGMGAKVLGRSVIGKKCLIAAGALVSPGMVVPDGHVVMGVPGKVIRPVKDEELRYMAWLTTHYVALAEKYVSEGFSNLAG